MPNNFYYSNESYFPFSFLKIKKKLKENTDFNYRDILPSVLLFNRLLCIYEDVYLLL